MLLCHQRDLKNYYDGDVTTKLPYKKRKIKIGKNAMNGMGNNILPNVEEGLIVAVSFIVTKDIPKNVIPACIPAKVIDKWM